MKASSIVRPAAVGGIAGFVLLTMSTGAFAGSAAHHQAKTAPAACATRPKSALLAAAVSPSASPTSPSGSPSTSPSGSATPDATPTASESTIPYPTKSADPIASTSTSPSQAPTSPPASTSPPTSKTPTPAPTSKTPTPTPTSPSPSPSPSSSSPSPSPSSSPTEPQLCVLVQSLSGSTHVGAGQSAGFVVWVWSAGGPSNSVTVTAKVAAASNVGAPKFTLCPQASGATCTLGMLPAKQADELQVVSAVGSAATSTEQVELTATATGKDVLSDDATESLAVTAQAPTASPSAPGGFSLGGSPVSLQPLPELSVPAGTAGNPAGLFPTVAPIPSSSSSAIGFPPARKQAARSAANTASAIVPLDPRLFGGQLAGLAVLAGAIAIAIARLSLRRPRPQDGSSDKPTDS